MFKFYSKGDHRENESVLFLNGQKICSIYAMIYSDGEIAVQIEDGNGRLMKEWEDFAEDYERLN